MPTMCVTQGVTLTNPFGDGRDYMGGESIDLPPEKAEQWQRWGWVHTPILVKMEPAPEALTEAPIDAPRVRKRKGDDAD